MTCRELAGFLDDYIAGDLTEATMHAVELHLARCVNCRRYLASYQESIRLGRRVFEDDFANVPPEVPEELVRAIVAARVSH